MCESLTHPTLTLILTGETGFGESGFGETGGHLSQGADDRSLVIKDPVYIAQSS